MALDGQEISNQLRAGTFTLDDLQNELSTEAASPVTVTDWNIVYSNATGQLSEYCTVTSNSSSNPIVGVGIIAYSADGSQMWMVAYTNNFSSNMVLPSIGTTLYTPSMGNQALCVVYGWTNQGSFYLTQKLTIGTE